MTGDVWFSRVRIHTGVGDKAGLRVKYYGHPWQDPFVRHRPPPTPEDVLHIIEKHSRGFPLSDNEFPEAAAIYDENLFRSRPELFYVGGFIVLRKGIADLLRGFDLGPVGLVPFTIYNSDLETPWPEPFWLLGLGATKQTYLHEHSRNVTKAGPHPITGSFSYLPAPHAKEGDFVLSCEALAGCDLWIEKNLRRLLFLSDRLATALVSTGRSAAWELGRCRVVGGEES